MAKVGKKTFTESSILKKQDLEKLEIGSFPIIPENKGTVILKSRISRPGHKFFKKSTKNYFFNFKLYYQKINKSYLNLFKRYKFQEKY